MERIVVGIDGSAGAARALRWAAEEARLRGASLDVVHAWHMPYFNGYPYVTASFDYDILEEAARSTLDTAVEALDVDVRVPVERILVQGAAAPSILDVAKDADMVVVGSRGLAGFSGLLLGSVSHHVVHNARCTVAVVPSED